MYRKTEHQLTFVEDLFLPFGGKLNKVNRRVRSTQLSLGGRLKKNMPSPSRINSKANKLTL